MLPRDLKQRAKLEALEAGQSLGEFIREAMEAKLQGKVAQRSDRLFEDQAVYKGKAPIDGASHHDSFLYEER